jgi:integrase
VESSPGAAIKTPSRSIAGIAQDRKAPLFRSVVDKTGKLSDQAVWRTDVYRMIRRPARAAAIETPIGCHTFRATGITD